MTLMPGDVIACGTSLGVGVDGATPSNTIEIVIDGVGTLSNTFDQVLPSPYLLRCRAEADARLRGRRRRDRRPDGGEARARRQRGDGDRPRARISPRSRRTASSSNGMTARCRPRRSRRSTSAADAGKQDLVILAVKAHFLDQVVREHRRTCSAPTRWCMTVQNGLPWWYFQKLGGKYDNQQARKPRPDRRADARRSTPNRLIGCVVYPAAAVTAPGVIHHVEGDRFPIGELDGKETRARQAACTTCWSRPASSRACCKDIRSEIWLKAWGNLSFNPISALTHATLVDICQFPETRQLAARMMEEAQAIAQEARRHLPRHDREAHRRRRERRRAQDLDAAGRRGRPLARDRGADRLDPRDGASSPTRRRPAIESVYALVKLLNKVMLMKAAACGWPTAA